MIITEMLLFFTTVAMYVISALIYLYSLLLEKEKWIKYANIFLTLGVISNFSTMAVRYNIVQHLPVRDSYELNLFGAFLLAALFLVYQKKTPAIRYSGVIALPFAIFMLGYALTVTPDMAPLGPAYKSYWLYIHVISAFTSYASWGIGVGCSVMYIIKDGKNASKPFFDKFPKLSMLDDYTFKFVAVGFIANTVMLASGSMWAKKLWGEYWSWDPLETWSLVGWLVYAVYLHLKLTLGWKGKKLAYYNYFALFIVIISYWGLPYIVKASPLTEFHFSK